MKNVNFHSFFALHELGENNISTNKTNRIFIMCVHIFLLLYYRPFHKM